MTDNPNTPAVTRAANALRAAMSRPGEHTYEDLVRPVLSAALVVEDMAVAMQDRERVANETIRTWDEVQEWAKEWYRTDARAIRTSVLGSPPPLQDDSPAVTSGRTDSAGTPATPGIPPDPESPVGALLRGLAPGFHGDMREAVNALADTYDHSHAHPRD